MPPAATHHTEAGGAAGGAEADAGAALRAVRALPSLRELAPRGTLVGASMGSMYLNQSNKTDEALYRALFQSQFGVALSEIECKWKATQAQGPHEYTLEACRAAFAYARANGQQFRGHNLAWNVPQYNPDWLNDNGNTCDSTRNEMHN